MTLSQQRKRGCVAKDMCSEAVVTRLKESLKEERKITADTDLITLHVLDFEPAWCFKHL